MLTLQRKYFNHMKPLFVWNDQVLQRTNRWFHWKVKISVRECLWWSEVTSGDSGINITVSVEHRSSGHNTPPLH